MKFGYVLSIFGKGVVTLREKKGITQEQLADSIGQPVEYLRQLEKGEIDVDFEMIFNLIHQLNVPVREFFNEEFDHIPRRV